MDHISRIEIFLEVVKQQSFSGAARKLGISPPAVSKQIQTLEDDLGVRLLNRTTRKVTLSEEGALYNEKARKALADLEEAERHIQELKAFPTGILKINAPMSFGKNYLAEPIAKFAKEYVQVKLEVDFDDRRVDIVSEGYDVVIRIGALQDSTFISRKLGDCPIVLCASKEFIKENGCVKNLDDLAKLPAIIYNKHNFNSQWQHVDKNGDVATTNLKQQMYANSAEMMLEACLKGVGVALLPIFVADEYLKSGQLVQILEEYETFPQRGIYAIFPQNRHLSTRVRLFVDWLSQCSKEFPW